MPGNSTYRSQWERELIMEIHHKRCARERGATGTEYALVIGFISLAIVAAAVSLGGGFNVWAAGVVETVADLLG